MSDKLCRVALAFGLTVALGLLLLPGLHSIAALASPAGAQTQVFPAEKQDVSPPLRTIASAPPPRVRGTVPLTRGPALVTTEATGAIQPGPGAARSLTSGVSFEGMGQGLNGYVIAWEPPDPNGAVGPNHFVQVVNTTLAVFSKTGALLFGPVPIKNLFSGFGGTCESSNQFDPSVLYDQLADRWLVGYPGATAVCLAVSQSGDPTGSYFRYAFPSRFEDYAKFGIWPDAYYMTGNGDGGHGGMVYAFDRSRMLAGLTATAQQVSLPTDYSLLPATLDGPSPPPGSPEYFANIGSSTSLNIWKFHVDWTTPANSALLPSTRVGVAAFTSLCAGQPGFFDCIPQAGSTQLLEALSDRLMYRLAYRNFGDHESLVVNHSVAVGQSGGVRWYEIRSPGSAPVVFQQGSYSPDSNYRWMGSIAMDRLGDIAVGYSLSGASLSPSIAYTGRLAGDPLGAMTQAEVVLVTGSGNQSADRWGDYTSMVVDPTDGCTFWYTNEYVATSGNFNWRTRVGSFRFPNCADTIPPTVTAVTPSNGATGVALGVLVGGGFSEALDPSTVTTSTLTVVKQATSTPIAGTVTYDANLHEAWLSPTGGLLANTCYTATFRGGTAGIKDLAGNALASDFVWSFCTSATPRLVQTAVLNSSGTSATVTYTSPVSGGDLLVAAVRIGSNSAAATVTDNNANAWQLIDRQADSGGEELELWYAPNAMVTPNAQPTLTIRSTVSATIRAVVADYSGIVTSNPLDQHTINTGVSTGPVVVSGATSQGNELVIGYGEVQNTSTFTPGAGYVMDGAVPSAPGTKVALEHAVVASAGTQTAGFSVSSQPWAIGVATFRGR